MMARNWLFALLVLLAAADLSEGLRIGYSVFGWKPRCPEGRVRLALRQGRSNQARGSCEVIGWRRDTCTDPTMSCCQNIVGDFLCIRTDAVENKRQGLLSQLVNQFGVSDHNLPSFSNWRRFMRPLINNENNQQNEVDPPTEEEKELNDQSTTQKATTESVSTAAAVAAPADVIPDGCPQATKICDDSGDNCAVSCPGYVGVTTCEKQDDCPTKSGTICCPDPCPGSGIKLCLAPVISDAIVGNAEVTEATTKSATTEEAVPKAADQATTTTKKPVVESTTKAATSAATATTKKQATTTKAPTATTKKGTNVPPKKKIVQDDAGESRFVCPAGDFTSCIGWSAVPGRPGTGVCTADADCEKGRLCCKISECNDDVKYCVPQFDKSKLPAGCPVPQWTAVFDATPCGASCGEGKICCSLDMQGTKGCVKPTKN